MDSKLYNKADKKKVLGFKWKFDADPDNSSIMRFDYLVKFILDFFCDRLRDNIEKFYTSLQLYNSSTSEQRITYQEFVSAVNSSK